MQKKRGEGESEERERKKKQWRQQQRAKVTETTSQKDAQPKIAKRIKTRIEQVNFFFNKTDTF